MKNSVVKKLINDYRQEVKKSLNNLDSKSIEKIISLVMEAYKNEKTIFILGNGGAASTASHMACDLGKGTLANHYNLKENRLRVISLTDNVSTITAYANDLSYQDIFIQQMRNLIKDGDVLIVLSASGNSKNIIKAVKYAKECKAITIGLLGFVNGGKLGSLVDYSVKIKSKHYGPVEDIQLMLQHIIAASFASLKKQYDGTSKSKNKAVPYRQ